MSAIFEIPAAECVCVKSGDGPNCGERHEGYVCMRPARHEGEHVACSLHQHERPEFTSRESRAARASRWLSGRVTLPGRGAGISTLRLMRDLRRDGPMAATARTGKRAGTGVRYPHAAMGNAVVNGWVKPHAGHFVLTVMGLDVLDVAACVMEEMDAVWAWVETGVGAVPATEPAEAGTTNGGAERMRNTETLRAETLKGAA